MPANEIEKVLRQRREQPEDIEAAGSLYVDRQAVALESGK